MKQTLFIFSLCLCTATVMAESNTENVIPDKTEENNAKQSLNG